MALGYEVIGGPPSEGKPGDLLVTWNRHSRHDLIATYFEEAGGRVIVAENGYLGRSLVGQRWYALALSQHNGAGQWAQGGDQRWDDLNIEVQPWRDEPRGDVVVFATRHIGSRATREPPCWSANIARDLQKLTTCRVRVREHPGNVPHPIPIALDLQGASAAVTWGSSGALHALLLGVPVFYGFSSWIGAQAAAPVESFPHITLGDRLAMFRRLAWAMATVDEIASGEAIARLLA